MISYYDFFVLSNPKSLYLNSEKSEVELNEIQLVLYDRNEAEEE